MHARSFILAALGGVACMTLPLGVRTVYGQQVSNLRCEIKVNSAGEGGEGLSYDANGARCVAGNSGCDFHYSALRGARSLDDNIVKAVLVDDSRIEFAKDNSSGPPSVCTRSRLSSRLSWISSTTWVSDKGKIEIINSHSNQILLVSPSGLLGVDMDTTKLTESVDSVPIYVGAFGLDNFLLFGNATALLLDPKSRTRIATADFQGSSRLASPMFDSLTDISITGEEIIAYGSWKVKKDNASGKINPQEDNAPATLGFIRAKISRTPLKVINSDLLLAFDAQEYYLLGYHYTASNELGAFVVTMGDSAILRWYSPVDHQFKVVPVIPREFQDVPQLPKAKSALQVRERYLQLERSKVVAGIYGQGKFIYILTREPAKQGQPGSLWLLHKVDPVKASYLGSVRLPTQASHLTIQPTPQAWYVFERGTVDSQGNQEINSMLEIPTSWIASLESSPLGKASEMVSCGSVPFGNQGAEPLTHNAMQVYVKVQAP